MTDIDFSFIRLRDNLQDAHNLQVNPYTQNTYLGQVQLLPNAAYSYTQATNSPVPINFNSYRVYVVRYGCNTTIEEITGNVSLTPFTDANGIAQILIRYSILPNDYGSTLVYFRFDFTTIATNSFYTNPILITRNMENFTTRFDYRSDNAYEGIDYDQFSDFQSIQLNTYFREYVSQDELTPYYQISRKQNINQRVNNADINKYMFSQLDAWTAKRLKRMLYGDRVYITRFNDNIGIRNYMIEAFDMPSVTSGSNAAEAEFLVDPDGHDTRNPGANPAESNFIFSNSDNVEFSNNTNFIFKQ